MIKYYFGSPGAGKTTHAVYTALKMRKNYRHCVCNFDTIIPSVKYDTMLDLGKYKYPDNTLTIIDEAGIQYNNRRYKTMSNELISYFKKHRHFKNDIIVYSQSWEDIDITIRRLTDELWYLKKLGPVTMARKVRKFVTVNETDYQIIDGYKFENPLWSLLPFPFGKKTIEFIWRPKYYKYFDSFEDTDNLPIFDFSTGTYSKSVVK